MLIIIIQNQITGVSLLSQKFLQFINNRFYLTFFYKYLQFLIFPYIALFKETILNSVSMQFFEFILLRVRMKIRENSLPRKLLSIPRLRCRKVISRLPQVDIRIISIYANCSSLRSNAAILS